MSIHVAEIESSKHTRTKFYTGDHPLLTSPIREVIAGSINFANNYIVRIPGIYKNSLDPFPNEGLLASIRERNMYKSKPDNSALLVIEPITFEHLGKIYSGVVKIVTYNPRDIQDHEIMIAAKCGDTVVTYNDDVAYYTTPRPFHEKPLLENDDPMMYPVRHLMNRIDPKYIITYMYNNRTRLSTDIIELFFRIGTHGAMNLPNGQWLLPNSPEHPLYDGLSRQLRDILRSEKDGLNIALMMFMIQYVPGNHPLSDDFIHWLRTEYEMSAKLVRSRYSHSQNFVMTSSYAHQVHSTYTFNPHHPQAQFNNGPF